MSVFWGIVHYEFRMQIRRKALWIGLAVIFILMTLPDVMNTSRVREWQSDIGMALFSYVLPLVIFVPIVAGFFLSDRLYRDEQLLTFDWVGVSGASQRQYLWGKYLGAVAATLLATLVYWMLAVVAEVAVGAVPADVIDYAFAAFWVMMLPAYLFIGAYCIAVPSAMSLRLFQILFTCYWLWAHQQRVPSVAGTPLAPGGEFALRVLMNFSGLHFFTNADYFSHGPFGWKFEITPAMATLNITLLLLMAAAVLFLVERYLIWKQEGVR